MLQTLVVLVTGVENCWSTPYHPVQCKKCFMRSEGSLQLSPDEYINLFSCSVFWSFFLRLLYTFISKTVRFASELSWPTCAFVKFQQSYMERIKLQSVSGYRFQGPFTKYLSISSYRVGFVACDRLPWNISITRRVLEAHRLLARMQSDVVTHCMKPLGASLCI